MELRDWQQRLACHFNALRGIKNQIAEGFPIFALEHGLDSQEIYSLETALRVHVAEHRPSEEHALVWVVYSSELGYRYAGDEYWQTFEQETPGWRDHESRYWLRACFRSFQREFGGAKPTGSWANHFSIICWPITHAVLPKDLQRQLARILYELRHLYSGDILTSPISLGDLIAARSWNTTSRFQNFAQETELLGQIATALLLQEDGTENFLHRDTLIRIRKDLDEERRSREWLRSARQSAKERVQVRGLSSPGIGSKSSPIRNLEQARTVVRALGIEPHLVLRPADPSHESWEVLLEIPDLSHLLLRFPQTREILESSRCTVAGSSGRPLARGQCLFGSQCIVLSQWPRSDEILLRFEHADPQLDFLLRTGCLLRPAAKRLFRIASDGFAYECRRLRVRPGEQYILTSTGSPFCPNDYTTPISLSCEESYGIILQLPKALTLEWETFLQELGLAPSKAIEVWPAGLDAVKWDGDGYAEWLTSEQPCLAIHIDHPLESVQISMDCNSISPLELTPLELGMPIFVELPKLAAGRHELQVSAQSLAGENIQIGDLEIVVNTREPRPWLPDVASPQGPLKVQMFPLVPTLEELWEGRAELSLQGPANRALKCRISFFERDGEDATFSQDLPPISMPFSEDCWQSHFEKHFRRKKKAQEAYDTTRVCRLQFNADELGTFSVRCERDFTPLRWALRSRSSKVILQLIDDRGDADQPEICRMAFETPCVNENLARATEYEIPDSGCMYVANTENHTASIIVSPRVVHEFQDLGVVPNIEKLKRSPSSVIHLLEIAGRWARARLSGGILSATYQRTVVSALLTEMSRLLCGDNWADAETNAFKTNGPGTLKSLTYAVSSKLEAGAMREYLLKDVESLAHDTLEARIHFLATFIEQYHLLTLHSLPFEVNSDNNRLEIAVNSEMDCAKWFAEFALRLASDPAGVEKWAGQNLKDGVNRLLENPVSARAARFLVIATDRLLQSQNVHRELYTSWRWV